MDGFRELDLLDGGVECLVVGEFLVGAFVGFDGDPPIFVRIGGVYKRVCLAAGDCTRRDVGALGGGECEPETRDCGDLLGEFDADLIFRGGVCLLARLLCRGIRGENGGGDREDP